MLIWIIPFILLMKKNMFVSCQLPSVSSIDFQSFINQFCLPGSNNPGCSNSAVVTTNLALTTRAPPPPTLPTFRPQPVPIQPPIVTTPRPSPSEGCPGNEKRCPQLPGQCVPSDFDCNLIGSVNCQLPNGYGVDNQVLICGDGSRLGARCGNGVRVPVLTTLLLQCQGTSERRPVEKFSVMNGPGDNGGAGVYRCSSGGTWEPLVGSPFINNLIVSCRDGGCGRVPHPSSDLPIYRPWSWVRAIYKDNVLHCTGTLVTQNALVTAAHCVTRSLGSREKDPFIERYQLELPGPNSRNPIIKLQPSEFSIHPKYTPNSGQYQYDIAVIFFNFMSPTRLPTVCISNRLHRQELDRSQVVFDMLDDSQTSSSRTLWKAIKANWDHTCLTTSIRTQTARCTDTIRVQNSQFCAEHKGTSMSKGSSGGPYLAEMGNDIHEIWVLMGVLSATAKVSGDGCSQEHSVYGQVADEFRWLKDCVYDKRCSL